MNLKSEILAYQKKLIESDLQTRQKNFEVFKENIKKREKDSPNMRKILDEVRGK